MRFRLCLALLCFCFAAARPAAAGTLYPMGPFMLDVRSAGEQFREGPPPEPALTATGNFSAAELDSIQGGMRYWLERLGADFDSKIVINLAKVANPGGTAYSYTPEVGRAESDTYNYIVNRQYYAPDPILGYHTEIIYQIDYAAVVTRQLMDDDSITSTMTHELMHALDMGGVLREQTDGVAWNATSWTLEATSAWGSRLYDVNGRKGVNGDVAFNSATPGNRSAGVFVLPDFNADPTQAMAGHPGQVSFFPTFHGAAVDALTGGRGMPVMAGNGDEYRIDGGNVLGHPALLGSIMSYSPLRNMLFTELELAVLKDMGYAIDLKQSFGKSFYPTNLGGLLTTDPGMGFGEVGAYLAETAATVVNTAGFNSALSYGTGLHVYRDKLNVTQAADITASGHGAGGIRIDGVGNTVTVGSGVTVAANGSSGTGLLVSYGRNNVINLNGTLEATGSQGVGAQFGISEDFSSYFYKSGVPALVNSDDRYFYTKMNSDLNGALVDSFNIAGTLKGSLAAVHIDASAHVKAINLMQGAAITGNIVSEWNAWNNAHAAADTPANYGTALNVGVSDTAGTPDAAFSMRYDGDITGPASITLKVAGGTFDYNGTYKGLAASVQSGATLKGNANYLLYGDGTVASQAAAGSGVFTNAGTVSPGNSLGTINITGGFTNTGNLRMEFNASGEHDELIVSGVFNHDTGAGATVTVTPDDDYYSGTMTIPFAAMFTGGAGSTLPTAIDTFVPSGSPTLTMVMSAGPVYTLTTTRAANAYSQYAPSSDTAEIGRILDGIGDSATGDMQELLAGLDFSGAGGGGVASGLEQLSPEAFNSSAQASLESNRALSGALLRSMLQVPPGGSLGQGRSSGDEAEAWSAFVVPFGGIQHQRSRGDTLGYNGVDVGVFSGLERHFDGGLTAGVHTALTHRQVDVSTQAGSQTKTDSLYLGVQALKRPDPLAGGYLFGMARLGVENNTSARKVVIGGFQRTSRSEWVGLASAADLGGGYDWQAGPVSFGPLAGLDYAFSWRPKTNEHGGGAADLNLASSAQHGLRSSLGGQVRTQTEVEGYGLLQAGLSARWMYDLLGGSHTARGSFAGYDGQDFSSTTPVTSRNSMALQGSLALLQADGFKCSAFLGTELFRKGYSSVEGGMSLSWDF